MNINKLKVRELEKGDYYNSYLELLEQLTTVNKEDITYNDFSNFIDNINSAYNHKVFVCVIDTDTDIDMSNEIIVATATVFVEQKLIHNMGKVGHIEDVVCHENYRGQKIGKFIIDYCSNYCFKNGCYKSILDCSQSNIGFYNSCGFKNNGFQMAKYY